MSLHSGKHARGMKHIWIQHNILTKCMVGIQVINNAEDYDRLV